MTLLIFSFIYYFISHLQCVSRLCIVTVLKFIINQHFFFFSILVVVIFDSVLIVCLFISPSSSHYWGGRVQIYKNYAIPSFAYVGSAFSYVDY